MDEWKDKLDETAKAYDEAYSSYEAAQNEEDKLRWAMACLIRRMNYRSAVVRYAFFGKE